MTNAEAIETLRGNYPDVYYGQLREAVDAAIEALKAQDAAGDTISRQAAIDIASGYCHPANIAKELAKLPSAQPEQHGVCMDCAIRNVCKFKSGLGDYGYCSQWTKIEVE